MIPGDLLSAFPHRQFHTLPGLLDSWAALPNSNPNACVPMQGGSLYHFYDGLWYDPAERRTHDLPCERRARYRLSQPDTVVGCLVVFHVPSTARSFRDGTPIYCPLRRTWSSINTPYPPGIEPRAVAWQSITLSLRYASSYNKRICHKKVFFIRTTRSIKKHFMTGYWALKTLCGLRW